MSDNLGSDDATRPDESAATGAVSDESGESGQGTKTVTDDVVDASGKITESGTKTEPQGVTSKYRRRDELYLQVTDQELRNSRTSQVATTLFAAIGTFLWATYFDYEKDYGILKATDESAVALPYMKTTIDLLFYGAIGCWAIAVIVWFVQGSDIRRIKEKHGIYPWWKRLWKRYVNWKASKS